MKSIDEAVEWVKRCPNPMPADSEIEIRPLFEMANFGAEATPQLRKKEAQLHSQIEKQHGRATR